MDEQTQICRPVTSEHSRGFRWLASIMQSVDEMIPEGSGDRSLQHSLQFYTLYAQTGDEQYLNLCEDFLRFSLSGG
ncbi:MAG: hypothetical protein HYZ27_06750 [Deltaproteobacteria bacterium]|nr:hypothetical protein [Deltaproteobacteria bacterium]